MERGARLTPEEAQQLLDVDPNGWSPEEFRQLSLLAAMVSVTRKDSKRKQKVTGEGVSGKRNKLMKKGGRK